MWFSWQISSLYTIDWYNYSRWRTEVTSLVPDIGHMKTTFCPCLCNLLFYFGQSYDIGSKERARDPPPAFAHTFNYMEISLQAKPTKYTQIINRIKHKLRRAYTG